MFPEHLPGRGCVLNPQKIPTRFLGFIGLGMTSVVSEAGIDKMPAYPALKNVKEELAFWGFWGLLGLPLPVWQSAFFPRSEERRVGKEC